MDYAKGREKPDLGDAPAVALIHGIGAVALAQSENQPYFGDVVMGSDTIVAAIDEALEDTSIKAVVLRVNSPGGSYVASDAIWRAVQRARNRNVPVIVSMSDVAASGGYFVAAPATKIVAQPGTVTGSIGVVSGKFVFTELWDDLGINFDGVQAGARADMGSMNRDFTPQQWIALQRQLNEIYADFTDKVAMGRGLSPDQIEEVAKGRIWTGADAQKNGLVDALGGYREAFVLAKQEAGIAPETPVRVTPFPGRRDPFRALLEDYFGAGLGGGPAARTLSRLMHVLAPVVETLERAQADPREQRLRARGVRLAD
jgi:protease-4